MCEFSWLHGIFECLALVLLEVDTHLALQVNVAYACSPLVVRHLVLTGVRERFKC